MVIGRVAGNLAATCLMVRIPGEIPEVDNVVPVTLEAEQAGPEGAPRELESLLTT